MYSRIVLSVFCLFPFLSLASSPFGIHGSFGIYYDMYNYSVTQYETFRPRHPSDLGRFAANATITAGEHFSMPFGINISNQSRSYHLPSLPEERFIDYVQNPRNNIHFSPSYKWAQGFFGTQSPAFSELTTGDMPIFGAGVEINPGRFLFSAHYGKSQLAVNTNPAENIAGAWEQRILASRIGIGRQDGTMVALHVVHRQDDISSVDASPIGLFPHEGLTVSPLLQIQFSETVLFSTETAGSVYTHNLNGPPLPYENVVTENAENLLSVNGSTNTDFSNITSLEWQSDRAGLGAEVRYIGPGFEAAGYRTMERDLIDYNLNTNVQFLDNKIMLNGTAGIRENNLQNTTAESTRRFIANVNLYTQVSENLSINTNYANFGFRNNVVFDTLRVEMVQNNVSLSPSLQLNRDELNHIINVTAGMQLFDEYNVFTGDFVTTQSSSINLNYNIVFNNIPLNTGLMGMYLSNETPVMDMTLYHVGINARYSFLDDRLRPSVMLAHSGISRGAFTTDYRWRLNVKTDFEVRKNMDVRFGYTFSDYRYGSARPGAKTREHRLQLSVVQQF